MTKESAQQLKALGFPQMADGGESKTAYAKDGSLMTWNQRDQSWPKEIDAYVPTSRELVRAFGSDLTADVLADAWIRLRQEQAQEVPLEELIP